MSTGYLLFLWKVCHEKLVRQGIMVQDCGLQEMIV